MRYALEKHPFFQIILALVFVTLLAVATGGCPLLGDNYVYRIAKQFKTYSP
jgi:hypothetical protein